MPLRRSLHTTVSMSGRRISAAVALVAVVVAGLGVHLLLPDTVATDIAGDALYAVAVYGFVVAVAPRLSSFWVGAISAAWCVAVELFQLTGIPLVISSFRPAVLVLGTVFDPRDLVVYVSAIIVAAGIDAGLRALTASRRGRPAPSS